MSRTSNTPTFNFDNYVAPKQYYQVYMVDAKTGFVLMTSKVFDSYTDCSSFLDSVKSNTNRDSYFYNISYLTNYRDSDTDTASPVSFTNPLYREDLPRNPPVSRFHFAQPKAERKVNKINIRRNKNEKSCRKASQKHKNVKHKEVPNVDSISQQFKKLRFANDPKSKVNRKARHQVANDYDTNTNWNIVDSSLNSVNEELENLRFDVNENKDRLMNSLVDEVNNDEMDSTDNEGKLFDDMVINRYGKGYLLHSYEDHPDFGTKYYHNAWWMPSKQAWFFKKEFKDYFLENGAVLE